MGAKIASIKFSNILFFLLSFNIIGIKNSEAANFLAGGSKIRDGQTLVSNNMVYELGFFSPGRSKNRYVGIWYRNMSEKTVVWVANREKPISDSSGTLSIDRNGNLTVLDGTGRSFLLASGSGTNSYMAFLLNSGNFVFCDGNNRSQVFWESFDYPTDTLLPGMKVGLEGKHNRLLTSWKSSEDPSPGPFSFGFDPNDTNQLFIWKDGQRYWTSGSWNGKQFLLFPEPSQMVLLTNFTFISNLNETYLSCYPNESDTGFRFRMDISGKIQQWRWSESILSWTLSWFLPRVKCDTYGYCGLFTFCDTNSFPPCNCLNGFEPVSLAEWSKSNWTGGCRRKSKLHCAIHGAKDSFLPIPSILQPINELVSDIQDTTQCKMACLENCSCNAYAFSEKCLMWGDILNLQQLTGDSGQTLYLRLDTKELSAGGNGGKRKVLIAFSLSASIVLLFCFFILYSWRRRVLLGKRKPHENSLFRFDTALEGNEESPLAIFSFSSITYATLNFSEENKLGEGGFGSVYKGFLEGQEVAVKRLSRMSGQGFEEFKNEILLLAKLQHRNLVRLLGCCIHGEEKMLIYEYMPNKSLDFLLFSQQKAVNLNWGVRFHIIEGIAQGLLYLHKYSRMRIIHRDLKASNVLLDRDMNPKISDFGMARIFVSDDYQSSTRRVVGTYGYMAPEYVMKGAFSIKSDVFSFGVLLLEIISGKRSTDYQNLTNSLNLLGHAWELWNVGRGLELVDESLGNSFPHSEVLRCIHIALLCVQECAEDRPVTAEVAIMISSETGTMPSPRHPAFFTWRNSSTGDQLCIPECDSINDVTVSVVEAR